MRLVLLGAPGCGKGTHSEWMVKELNIPQISTGDILRDAVRGGTDLGQQAKQFMDSGALVPDELILDMMKERLGGDDAKNGFILDGFPRTVAQAEGLARTLAGEGQKLDRVVRIDVDANELVGRLTSRRVCLNCKAVYNVSFRPPKKDGICDACGNEIIQRPDDSEETVRERLKVYEDQTAPLIDHYGNQSLLATVDGNQGFAEAQTGIRTALGL